MVVSSTSPLRHLLLEVGSWGVFHWEIDLSAINRFSTIFCSTFTTYFTWSGLAILADFSVLPDECSVRNVRKSIVIMAKRMIQGSLPSYFTKKARSDATVDQNSNNNNSCESNEVPSNDPNLKKGLGDSSTDSHTCEAKFKFWKICKKSAFFCWFKL